MKKYIILLAALLAWTGTKAQTTWDFTVENAADVAALKAATSDWTYTEASNRFENKKAINGALKAGSTELALTKGLTFNAAEKKLRIDVANRVQLAGKNVQLIITGLKKGQVVTVNCASTGDNATTLDATTNLNGLSGFTAADKDTKQTGTGTVAQDGDVSLASSTGSMNVYSICVSAAPEGGESASQDVIVNDVTKNPYKMQAVLKLHSGEAKYYNTEELRSIDIDDTTNKITVSPYAANVDDEYNNTVADITFTKPIDEGQQGEINNGGVEITEAKGWYETVYAKWKPFDGATTYHVYVKGGNYADFTKIDEQLVRNYGSYGRADVVGLVAGNYSLKVVPVVDDAEQESNASTADNLGVVNYPREGFAFMGGNSPGAYNSDGSLKANAVVIYVTANNAKTVTAKLSSGTFTGIQAILDAYQKKGANHPSNPLSVRIIGTVNASDVDNFSSSEEGIQVKGAEKDQEHNITIEGIGEDATVKGFGFLVRNSKNIEFRNFAVMRCMDDGLSLDTDNSNIWIHHMDMFYGKHGSGDHDKGDGAIDVKSDSKYVTVNYCHEWDTGKSNMFGMKSESGENWISYDHNWFDHSDSRHPRVRTMSVHVWNNYFDNNAKYGVGATSGSSVFVENNYFLNTKKPILSSNQGTDALGSGTFSGEDGGMIKAFGNYFDTSAKNFRYYTQKAPTTTGYDAYETDTRDEQVPASEVTRVGNTSYNNFDTNSSVMYSYNVDDAEDVPAKVMGYYGAGRLNHGDFQYSFPDNVGNDDADSAYDTTLGGMIDSYTSALVGIFGDENAQSGEQGGDDPGNNPGGEDQPTGTIVASFDSAPSNSMFTVGGSYGDGKATYEGTYYKKGVKLDSKGSITFTPKQDYNMTIVMGTAKSGRNVSLNGTVTTVSGTENANGMYYELESIPVTKDTQYSITKGSAEGLVMIIKLVPVE